MASGLGLGVGHGQGADQVDHLNMLPALDGPGASELDHLSGCGEVHPGGSLNRLDSTPHPPPMTGIDPGGGWDVLPGQRLERLAKDLLVALDGEKVVTTLIADPLGSVLDCWVLFGQCLFSCFRLPSSGSGAPVLLRSACDEPVQWFV